MEHAGAFLGLRRVSETVWLGWRSPVLLSKLIQQPGGALHRCSGLFGTLRHGVEGGFCVYLCNVFEKLLPFRVLRPREEGTDKRFDRVTLVDILQRSAGPARHELFVKLRFPPFRFAKERKEFVRHVLKTSSTESPEYLSQFVVSIHGRLTSRSGV